MLLANVAKPGVNPLRCKQRVLCKLVLRVSTPVPGQQTRERAASRLKDFSSDGEILLFGDDDVLAGCCDGYRIL